MDVTHNITMEMNSFAGMQLGGMAMDVGMGSIKEQHNIAHSRPLASSANTIPKKKRRLNAKAPRAAAQKSGPLQDLGPPVLTGCGDTVHVSNPFDDAPPKTSHNAMPNIGSSQRLHHQRMDFPPIRNTNPMMPRLNAVGAPLSQNMASAGPMMNQMNNMGGFRPMSQAPVNFMGPINNGGRNTSNGNISMNNHVQNGQMTSFHMAPGGNRTNVPCFNNTNRAPIPMNNNTNGQTRLNRPLNLPPTLNNNLQGQTGQLSGPHNQKYVGDIGHVERLMNVNMNISQQKHMVSGGPMGSTNQKKALSLGHPATPNGLAQHPNLQRALHVGGKQHPGEKIYPADQPMIFNYQNPHAPPIYPCGICHKEVNENDQGIICESGCNFWFHRTCLGLSEAAFQLLTQEIYAEWVCDNCLRSKNIPVVKFKS